MTLGEDCEVGAKFVECLPRLTSLRPDEFPVEEVELFGLITTRQHVTDFESCHE